MSTGFHSRPDANPGRNSCALGRACLLKGTKEGEECEEEQICMLDFISRGGKPGEAALCLR